MKILLILDVAHGKDVAGKRSPDGVFLEYKWSRELCSGIMKGLTSTYFDVLCPFLENENEPGISKRRKYYEGLAKNYDRTVVISFHVDAYGDGSKWYNTITGFSFWTTKGETLADKIATFIGTSFHDKFFRDEKFRFAYWLTEKEKNKDLDWEANFGVINSEKYNGILVEHNFQTNYNDVYNKLLVPAWNQDLTFLWQSTITGLMIKIKEGEL